MRILIAPDKFRDSLSCYQAADAIYQGFKKKFPNFHYEIQPLSDGGEFTLDLIVGARNGNKIQCNTFDPLGRNIKADLGIVDDPQGRIGIVESAKASGLALLRSNERNPVTASSYGTGLLIRFALDNQCSRIIVGLGGTATIDGGIGLLQALGAKFLNSYASEIPPFAIRDDFDDIDFSNLDLRLKNTDILVACDVDIPMLGPQEPVKSFGLQKGALPEDFFVLNKRLSHLANTVERHISRVNGKIPFSGAGGGMAFALIACGAKATNGADAVFKYIDIRSKIKNCDLAITGEGKLDNSTLFGKPVMQISALARRYKKPCVAIVGIVDPDFDYHLTNLDGVMVLATHPYSMEYVLSNAYDLLVKRATELADLLNLLNYSRNRYNEKDS